MTRRRPSLLSPGWPVALTVAAVLLCLVTIATFSPGYMSTDTIYQLKQALGRVPLTDWHPPVMSLLWGGLISLTGTWTSMLVLQSVVMWGALLVVALVVHRWTGSRTLSALALAVGLMPNVLNIAGVVWKDVHLALALLSCVAIAMLGSLWRGKPLARWTLVPLGVVLVVYALMVRKNGVFAILPVLYLLGYSWFPRSRWKAPAALTLAAVLLTVGTQSVVNSVARPEPTHQLAQVMIDDIIHVVPAPAIREADVSDDLKDRLLRAQALCERKRSLVNAYWTCYGRGANGPFTAVAHYDELKSVWPGMMLSHPAGYLQYRAQAFSLFLFDHRDAWQPGVISNDLGITVDHPRMTASLGYYVQDFGERDVRPLFAAWFWLAISVLLVARSLRLGPGRHRVLLATLGLSSALYIVGYLPVVPATDFRYVYWPSVAGTMGLLLLLVQRAEPLPAAKEPTEGREGGTGPSPSLPREEPVS